MRGCVVGGFRTAGRCLTEVALVRNRRALQMLVSSACVLCCARGHVAGAAAAAAAATATAPRAKQQIIEMSLEARAARSVDSQRNRKMLLISQTDMHPCSHRRGGSRGQRFGLCFCLGFSIPANSVENVMMRNWG